MPETRSNAGPTGVVFDIQRFSLGDGTGIRTTVFLKGCPLRCRWCQNPESFHLQPELAFRRERCIESGACAEACPREAIRLGEDDRIDLARCDSCGICVEACPTEALLMIGRRYTVAELLAEVERDAVFYAESGGGVTVSGGEPTMQLEFVRAFLQACKDAGFSTAIETNGFAPRESYEELIPVLDRVYFDLKAIAPEDHQRLTGVGNMRILRNARWLVGAGVPVGFRLPLVAGMTATEENIRRTAEFLNSLGMTEVELCPYQDSWEGKLSWLQTVWRPMGVPPFSAEDTRAVVNTFSAFDITAAVSA